MALYAAPTAPAGSVAVSITGDREAIVRVNVFDAESGAGLEESWAVTVTVLIPGTLTVPVICPVLEFIDSPAGKPDADH